MRALGVDSLGVSGSGVSYFDALNARANQDPAWFHDALIRFLDYRFMQPYERVLEVAENTCYLHAALRSALPGRVELTLAQPGQ